MMTTSTLPRTESATRAREPGPALGERLGARFCSRVSGEVCAARGDERVTFTFLRGRLVTASHNRWKIGDSMVHHAIINRFELRRAMAARTQAEEPLLECLGALGLLSEGMTGAAVVLHMSDVVEKALAWDNAACTCRDGLALPPLTLDGGPPLGGREVVAETVRRIPDEGTVARLLGDPSRSVVPTGSASLGEVVTITDLERRLLDEASRYPTALELLRSVTPEERGEAARALLVLVCTGCVWLASRGDLSAGPLEAEAWHALAIQLKDQGRTDQAVVALRRALGADPKHTRALEELRMLPFPEQLEAGCPAANADRAGSRSPRDRRYEMLDLASGIRILGIRILSLRGSRASVASRHHR
jgi:hypothetical protein